MTKIIFHIKRIKDALWRNKKYLLVALALLAIVLFVAFGSGNGNRDVYEVKRITVEQSAVLSGEVKTSDKADLGFASGGRISRIYVANNQKVRKGQTLAQLEVGDLFADLKIKQANLRSSTVELDAARSELGKITKEEDTKVESAYRTLLSDGLVFTPDSELYDVEPPTLTGIYDGPEGKYKIIIDQENSSTFDFVLRTFLLETSERVIARQASTPLGTRGLYISFPDDEMSLYDDTIWYVNIPNKATTSYVANLNAYNQAKEHRDVAVEQARAKYDTLLAEGKDSNTTVAEAEVQKINAEIRKHTIHAPFNGIVTNIEKEIGENASTGERVVSVLGEQKLEVVLQVSELDVSRLAPDMKVSVTLDAFPGETFEGILKTINSRETEIEGVPVYEAFVDLTSNPEIKTGMSAKGTIVLTSRTNVLAIPSYFITKEGNVSTVKVLTSGGKEEDRTVTLGLSGSDSMVEVTSGLKEGDTVVGAAKK